MKVAMKPMDLSSNLTAVRGFNGDTSTINNQHSNAVACRVSRVVVSTRFLNALGTRVILKSVMR
jgi:hypothetical protein